MQLTIKIELQGKDSSGDVALQCCGELLSENLRQDVMVCNVCGAQYPLNTVRALIERGHQVLSDLRLALQG